MTGGSVRLALLTTDTPHHRYFAWKLAETHPISTVIVEQRRLKPTFETSHAFEADRDAYERDVLLGGREVPLGGIAPAIVVDSANDAASVDALVRSAPDVVLVFGTGRLEEPVIRAARYASLNLHGGNPERYRGLDTHLWAIYHGDFADLVTTLHFVDVGLDTGDLVLQSGIPLERSSQLHELRGRNTQVCLQLTRMALLSLESGNGLPRRRQAGRGRYYSHMPAVLKGLCQRKFVEYCSQL